MSNVRSVHSEAVRSRGLRDLRHALERFHHAHSAEIALQSSTSVCQTPSQLHNAQQELRLSIGILGSMLAEIDLVLQTKDSLQTAVEALQILAEHHVHDAVRLSAKEKLARMGNMAKAA